MRSRASGTDAGRNGFRNVTVGRSKARVRGQGSGAGSALAPRPYPCPLPLASPFAPAEGPVLIFVQAVRRSKGQSHFRRPRLRAVPRKSGQRQMLLALALTFALLAAAGCARTRSCCGRCPRVRLSRNSIWPRTAGQSPRSVRSNCCGCTISAKTSPAIFARILQKLQAISEAEPSADTVYALAELAFIGAKKAEPHDKQVALDLYGASVLHAYDYLFDPAFRRRHATPTIRTIAAHAICTTARLESALRIICANKELVPGTTKTINTASGAWDITLQTPRQPLAARRLRAIRVRFRLRFEGPQKSLSDARAGRAADRRAAQLRTASRWPASIIPPG